MIAELTGGMILEALESKGFPAGRITDMFPDPLVMLGLPEGKRLILAPAGHVWRCSNRRMAPMEQKQKTIGNGDEH